MTDKATLKSYFNKGDVPSEQNFAELIDSIPDTPPTPFTPSYAKVTEQYSSGTPGGPFGGGIVTRELNTIVSDPDSIIVAPIGISHEIVLDPGTYYVSAASVMTGVGGHRCELGFVTMDNQTNLWSTQGLSVACPAGVSGISFASGRVVLLEQAKMQVFDAGETTNVDTNALGYPMSGYEALEVYCWLEIWKVG